MTDGHGLISPSPHHALARFLDVVSLLDGSAKSQYVSKLSALFRVRSWSVRVVGFAAPFAAPLGWSRRPCTLLLGVVLLASALGSSETIARQ